MASVPDAMVGALLTEACSNGGAFFLDDSSLVRNGFRGADVSNELLDFLSDRQISY